MATPDRIFAVYYQLHANAAEVRDFQIAKGEKVSGTVRMLLEADRSKLLARWGEEMTELCGVIDGSHDDPFIMEATQCFYWASLYAVTGGATWADIGFAALRPEAGRAGIPTVEDLRRAVIRMVEAGPAVVKPSKLFLLWHVADALWRSGRPVEQQWTLEQVMEYDLADMRKRTYLEPILRMTEGL